MPKSTLTRLTQVNLSTSPIATSSTKRTAILMKRKAADSGCRVFYETGIEESEILGSGSSFSSVITTPDESEAFQAYRSGGRNYLLRATYSIDRPRMIERWDKEQECWRT